MPVNPESDSTVQPGSTPQQRNLLKEKFGEDWDAAGQSYQNIVAQRQDLEQQLAQARATNGAYEQMLAQGRVNPADAANARRSAWDELSQFALPIDAFKQAVGEVVSEQLNPLIRGFAARETVMTEFTDYAQVEAEAIKYIRSNPALGQKYNSMAQSNPDGALEWAYLRYKNDVLARQPATPSPETESARVAAGLPGTSTPGQRSVQSNDDAEKAALLYAHQKGDTRAYFTERLKGAIVDTRIPRE